MLRAFSDAKNKLIKNVYEDFALFRLPTNAMSQEYTELKYTASLQNSTPTQEN